MNRSTTIIGNWKMHKTIGESVAFVKSLVGACPQHQGLTIGLAVPFTALQPVTSLGVELLIGAQNMHECKAGAFTGEISSAMLKEAGADFVLLGHSERRHIFNESNETINKKVKAALEAGLQPVVCVGEKLEERETKEQVLKAQILGSLAGLSKEQMGQLILAYEPVWAIGTGVVAHPDDAEEAHRYLRSLLSKEWGEQVAENMVIQYGGSVKPENSQELLAKRDIDGLLIGGASLDVDTFSQIIKQEVT